MYSDLAIFRKKKTGLSKSLLCKKASRSVYTCETSIDKVRTTPENSQAKWERDCNMENMDKSHWQEI